MTLIGGISLIIMIPLLGYILFDVIINPQNSQSDVQNSETLIPVGGSGVVITTRSCPSGSFFAFDTLLKSWTCKDTKYLGTVG